MSWKAWGNFRKSMMWQHLENTIILWAYGKVEKTNCEIHRYKWENIKGNRQYVQVQYEQGFQEEQWENNMNVFTKRENAWTTWKLSPSRRVCCQLSWTQTTKHLHKNTLRLVEVKQEFILVDECDKSNII